MPILLATDFQEAEWSAWMPALRDALPGERLLRSRSELAPGETVDVALVANPPRGALADLPGLRFVQSLWAGVDRLLEDPTVPPGLPIARMVDPAMSRAMSETALWATLSLHRAHFVYARQQREHVWQQHAQRRVDEIEVLVLGLGEMGRACARRLAANGYRVHGWASRETTLAGVSTGFGPEALERMLGEAEIVINLLPLTDATRGLFGRRTFERMRPGAAIVNLGRGRHVVEDELLAALDAGRLSHAVLDVFSDEPLGAAHPFWSRADITVLPHVAAQTDPRSAALIAARNVRALREGRAPEHLVDRTRGY